MTFFALEQMYQPYKESKINSPQEYHTQKYEEAKELLVVCDKDYISRKIHLKIECKPCSSCPSANIFSRFFSKMVFHLKEKNFTFNEFCLKINLKTITKNSEKVQPPRLLKDCPVIILQPLHDIINLSLQTGSLPSNLELAKVYQSSNREILHHKKTLNQN